MNFFYACVQFFISICPTCWTQVVMCESINICYLEQCVSDSSFSAYKLIAENNPCVSGHILWLKKILLGLQASVVIIRWCPIIMTDIIDEFDLLLTSLVSLLTWKIDLLFFVFCCSPAQTEGHPANHRLLAAWQHCCRAWPASSRWPPAAECCVRRPVWRPRTDQENRFQHGCALICQQISSTCRAYVRPNGVQPQNQNSWSTRTSHHRARRTVPQPAPLPSSRPLRLRPRLRIRFHRIRWLRRRLGLATVAERLSRLCTFGCGH